jgi:hypothetical protein
MNDKLAIALVSSGSTVTVGVAALLWNYRCFLRVDQRLATFARDFDELRRVFAQHDVTIARLKKYHGLK